MINKFPSREYLMNCLTASCYIPIYSMGYFANAPVVDNEVFFYLTIGKIFNF